MKARFVISKDVQEIKNALGVGEIPTKYANKDSNGIVFFIQLQNGDYISNHQNTKPYELHYNPRPWNFA